MPAPIIPVEISFKAILKSIVLFLMWTTSAKTAVGIKYKRVIPCAIFWSKPRNIVSTGINIIPPPIPIPLIIPDTAPAIIK